MMTARRPPPKDTNFSRWDIRTSNYSNGDIYINLNVFNPISNTVNIPAIYDEQRTQTLLEDPKDWKCAVVSLYCPSTAIPLFEWEDFLPDGVTPFYTLSLAIFNHHGAAAPIQFTQQVFFTPYNSTSFVFLFNQIVLSVNTGFAAAFAGLVAAYNTIYGPGSWQATPTYPQTAPVLYNDTNDSLFTLAVPYLYNANSSMSNPINPTPGTPFVQISFNYRLNHFFNNFPSVDQGANPAVGNNVVIRVYDTQAPGWLGPDNRYIPAVPALPGFTVVDKNWEYSIKQQNSTTALISDIKAIVIQSDMPLRYEFTNVSTSTLGSIANVGILSDFAVSFNAAGNGESEQPLLYTPSPQYHWIDVLGADKFTRLNYGLQFVDQNGTFFPVMLQPGETCSMKLLFSKK